MKLSKPKIIDDSEWELLKRRIEKFNEHVKIFDEKLKEYKSSR